MYLLLLVLAFEFEIGFVEVALVVFDLADEVFNSTDLDVVAYFEIVALDDTRTQTFSQWSKDRTTFCLPSFLRLRTTSFRGVDAPSDDRKNLPRSGSVTNQKDVRGGVFTIR